ncbi:hypothetical protein CTI12_AA261850 [Artemisia annua]|uniref:Uncharacterized protein n=1 Tax=Artemisia annua TaxID=35608 RepID=A0A2U1NIJ7_ARTAN|nr:hypothetical protein CTI12_AA261850 [Artemisia annua]
MTTDITPPPPSCSMQPPVTSSATISKKPRKDKIMIILFVCIVEIGGLGIITSASVGFVALRDQKQGDGSRECEIAARDRIHACNILIVEHVYTLLLGSYERELHKGFGVTIQIFGGIDHQSKSNLFKHVFKIRFYRNAVVCHYVINDLFVGIPLAFTNFRCLDRGALKVWDLNTSYSISTIISRSECTVLYFSSDGDTFYYGHDDRYLRLWDTRTSKFESSLNAHSRAVTSVCLSKNGRTSGKDDVHKLLDTRKYEVRGSWNYKRAKNLDIRLDVIPGLVV